MDICPSADVLEAFVAGRLPPERRQDLEAHLDRCRTCNQLVVRLLSRFSEASPPTRVAGTPPRPLPPMPDGQKIGRFILLGKVGAGGMGTVFAAYDTSLDRKVALKFLSAAPADPRAMERVLAEAGAMAKLAHPNVVTVYDVGAHEDHPYLAMEFVEGQTLSEWRRERPRSLRELLAVMSAAARGLAAAHAAGIVHRDVKPSNILVSGPRVLVTDFGIAVRTGGVKSAPAAGTPAGTPAYMAPEQQRGGPVDARADVFGFCASLQEMMLVPPPRAPTWLQKVAARGTEPDPGKRYQDMGQVVAALAANPRARLQRILPVAAASAAFVTAFWVGGHRASDPLRRCQAGASAIDAIWSSARKAPLAAQFARAGHTSAWQIAERHLDRYAQTWRDRYRQNCSAQFEQRSQSGEVFDLRVACLDGRRVAFSTFVELLPAQPPLKLPAAATASAGLPPVAECDSSAWAGKKPLPADPEVRRRITATEATIEQTIAQTFLGNYARASELAASSVKAARQLDYEPVLAHALAQAAMTERRRGGVIKESGQDKEETVTDWAARKLEESFVIAERGRDDLRRASAARELVMTNLMRSRYDDAETWARRSAAILQRIGDPPRERASLEQNLGWLALQLDRRKEAAASFARSLELRRRVLPPDDPELVGPGVGACEAESTAQQQLRCYQALAPIARRILGPAHPDTAAIINNMAGLLFEDRRTLAEACRSFREAVEISRQNLEPSNSQLLGFEGNLANCMHELGELGEARRLYEEALARAVGPSLTTTRAHLQADYGQFLADTGQPAQGVRQLRESLAQRLNLFGEKHDKVLYTRSVLADLLVLDGQAAQGLQEIGRAIRSASADAEPTFRLAELHDQQGQLLQQEWKRFAEAKQAHLRALAVHERLRSPDEDRHTSWHGLGSAQLGLGALPDALTNLERALKVRAAGKVPPEEHADTAFALARALTRAGQQRPRSCELAQQSRAVYRKAGNKRQRQLGELERWLDQQHCPPRNPRT